MSRRWRPCDAVRTLLQYAVVFMAGGTFVHLTGQQADSRREASQPTLPEPPDHPTIQFPTSSIHQPSASASPSLVDVAVDLAYVTSCTKPDENNALESMQQDYGKYEWYDQCLASICSLLGTTNPPHVVVLVDRHFPLRARAALEAQGVLVQDSDDDEVCVWQGSERYPMSKHAHHPRLYTFRKLIAFKMTQYANVFWLDSDTEVRGNLTEYFLSLPRDRDAVIRKTVNTGCGVGVFNSGVMVRMYDELMDIWRTGDFQFNFAAGNNNCSAADQLALSVSEQDLLVEYFLKRETNRYHELDWCYNARNYPMDVERCGRCVGDDCPGVKVHHIAKLLKWLDMSAWQIHSWRGTCRTTPKYPAKRRSGVI